MPRSVTPAILALGALVIGALLSACGGPSTDEDAPDSGDPTSSSAAPTSAAPAPEPPLPAPEAATTPQEALPVIALSAADLPAGFTVEESPTDGDIADDPTFEGLCNFEFLSERRRTAKVPVTGVDPSGEPVVISEAVAYDAFDAAQLALIELRAAYEVCPAEQYVFTDLSAEDQSGLAEDRVVIEYTLPEGVTQTVLAQRRGAVLSLVLGEDRAVAFAAARAIYARMAALSPQAAGDE